MEYVVMFVIAGAMAALSYLLAPKAKPPPTQPPAEMQRPESREGEPIPVVFGRVLIRDPNVVWFGDASTRPIREKSGGKK
jgi:hypothetical protein